MAEDMMKYEQNDTVSSNWNKETSPQAQAVGTDGMDEIEKKNYEVLKASRKNFSDAESLYLATNPPGRLHPDPAAKKTEGDKSAAEDYVFGQNMGGTNGKQ